jgi:hypothetical protein
MNMLDRVLRRTQKAYRRSQLLLRGAPQLVGPLFIVGTVRSSTTLLANCLGNHPSVCHVGFELSEEWSTHANVSIACPDTQDLACPPLTEADASEIRGRKLEKRFSELMITKSGKNGRFLNKNPHLWNKLLFVRAIFPDASLIVISRDIRSTVASTKRLWIKVEQMFGRKHYLPALPDQCWVCTPPAPHEAMDPARLFPGGDVAVLAEYWLRTYELIEQHMAAFASTVVVQHCDLVADPQKVLNQIHGAVGLAPATYPLPAKIDTERNNRWRELLTPEEQRSLDDFIAGNLQRIERLTCADTRV